MTDLIILHTSIISFHTVCFIVGKSQGHPGGILLHQGTLWAFSSAPSNLGTLRHEILDCAEFISPFEHPRNEICGVDTMAHHFLANTKFNSCRQSTVSIEGTMLRPGLKEK